MTQQKKTYRGTSCDKQINSINCTYITSLLERNLLGKVKVTLDDEEVRW